MRGLAVIGVLLLQSTGQGPSPAWIEARHATYTIYYEPGYEADRDFAQTWLDRTESLMRSKYAVAATGYKVNVYLYSTANDHAGIGHAQVQTSGNSATIHYLAPTAPAWQTTISTTSLRLPYDQNYHAKVIVSEYIALAHTAVQATRTSGWRYYDAPSWVSQGLQEYDGFFHSTEFNRTAGFAKMREFGRTNLEKFTCCQDGLPLIADTYNGGALFMAYLAERFGEDIHVRLLRSTASTFASALRDETHTSDVSMLSSEFHNWLMKQP